ncbi:GFA family protein [Aeromonas dhakensis]|uniref:GFA family protein n=1 Tax=Aeromonas dhakensis TaxID=196024 RepID=UPI0021B42ADC|nr:GFA family protein [Aeromonas dhakensis]UXB10692.1 GFA family protein [Aeromonas dhakensis]
MADFKAIGNVQISPIHRVICHCGGVVIELSLPNGVENPRRCNCSICRRRGAICSSVPVASLRILQGEELLTLYQFNTHTAKHYFCKVCGIYTHHQRRSDPSVFAYNVGCLEGVNPFSLGEVPTSDGINHISDRKYGKTP